MDVEQFEQDILELAFETDVRITTASVAYYLGVPSTEAEPMLEELLERGVLELDSDSEGNLYYRVVDAAAPDSGKLSELKQERENGLDGGVDFEAAERAREQTASSSEAHRIGDATVDGTGEDSEAYSPRGSAQEPSVGESRESPRSSGSVGGERGGSTGERPGREGPESGGAVSEASRASRRQGRVDGSRSNSSGPLAGVTRKQAAMNASVDACGNEPLVVQADAECEPQPFVDSNPVVASCADQTEAASASLVPRERETAPEPFRRAGETSERRSSSGAMVYRDADRFEKPEHQPGMSLLLSLILCGTGQIYNGEVSKGIMMMVLCFLLWFVLLGWVVHIWSIVDSVVVAERINRQSGDNSQKAGPSRQLSGG